MSPEEWLEMNTFLCPSGLGRMTPAQCQELRHRPKECEGCKKYKKAIREFEMKQKEIIKSKVLVELMDAVGKENAISMAELHKRVFGKEAKDNIQDTRALRKIITELRKEGVPIASTTNKGNGGYYTPVGSEREEYCRTIRNRALKLLDIEAKIKKVALPQIVREISLSLGG